LYALQRVGATTHARTLHAFPHRCIPTYPHTYDNPYVFGVPAYLRAYATAYPHGRPDQGRQR